MKHLHAILAALLIAAAAQAQTIKSLGYNTTNGQVVYSGTNALTMPQELILQSVRSSSQGYGIAFQSAIEFDDTESLGIEAITRTNLGLPWAGLTNTNAAAFTTALGITVGLQETNLTPVTAAVHLFDETSQQTSLKGDDGEFSTSASFVTTNAPANTTNAVRWLILTEGTNSYRVPLYQ